MTSMALYVVLFFTFSAFAIAVSSNFNYQTLSEKGKMWVNEQFDKLQYNMVKSAKESDDVSAIAGKVVFSNNDEYEYDATNKRILKNGGIVAMDVEKFEIITPADINTSNRFSSDIDNNLSNIALNIELKKYGNEKVTQLFITAGDGIYENIQ